jgi:hypothetical protein
MFLTGTDNPDAGIIALRLYIRGKPWVVTIDDKLFFEQYGGAWLPAFTQPDSSYKIFWPAFVEKAMAKVKGTYEGAEGGFNVNGIRFLTGAPVFSYLIEDIGTADGQTLDATFDFLTAANNANYPMAAGTTGGSDTGRNDCGIAEGHAYSVIHTFTLNNGAEEVDMIMMRNPWGVTDYSGPWNHADANWTPENIAQVPFNIDPT